MPIQLETFPEQNYGLLAPLTAPLNHHLVIPAVLAGETPAKVWADDPSRPSVVVMKIKQKLFLAGDPDLIPAAGELLHEHVIPEGRAEGDWGFVLEYAPGWESRLEELVPQNLTQTVYLRSYLEHPLRSPPPPVPPPPEGFRIAEVARRLVEDEELGGREDLLEEMCSERPSVEDFLAKSFGVCLLHGETVAGWCLSEYNLGERCEVGIATAEPFRRRGLATLQGLAFLSHAHRAGIRRVGWHCWASNTGSVKTALALGFLKGHDYPAVVVEF